MTHKFGTAIISAALIILAGFASYANSLKGEFVWDDEVLIRDNTYIKNWSHASKAFTTDIGTGAGRRFTFYRPIQTLTYMMDYSAWRLNPAGYHLTNIALHIMTALALFYFVNILFNDNLLSVLTAVFFAVHPIHTVVVSYISTRAESLYLLFLLLAFIFYIKSIRSKKIIPRVLMVTSYALSLLSKEASLIFPALLLFYHHAFKERVRPKEFSSIIALVCFYAILRASLAGSIPMGGSYGTTFLERVPGFFVAMTNYARLFFLPFGLHIEYGSGVFNLAGPQAILGCAILLFIFLSLFKAAKSRDKTVFFSLGWFLIGIAPVSNLYPINAYMSENWLYLPSIGFFLIAAKCLTNLLKKKSFKTFAIVFTSALTVFYSFLTIKQNDYWREPETFYETTLKYAPRSARMRNNLGNIYYKEGRSREAIPLYEEALRLKPDYAEVYVNLANACYAAGKKEEAIPLYKKAIQILPDNAEARNNLANIYSMLGRKEEAVTLYKKVIELRPDYAHAYNNLGNIYYEAGEYDAAVSLYKKALQIDPDYADARNNLSRALKARGE